MITEVDASGAALVCVHIARLKLPVLYAYRDVPVEPGDSGWQFLCGGQDDVDELQVWSVDEVVEQEPSLKEWVSKNAPIEIARSSAHSEWERTNE